MLMSTYVKNNLNSIWNQTLTLIEGSDYFDSATFNAFIDYSTLYDIIDDLAIILVPSVINKKVFESVECLSFVQQKLSEVMDQTMQCEVRLKKISMLLTRISRHLKKRSFLRISCLINIPLITSLLVKATGKVMLPLYHAP